MTSEPQATKCGCSCHKTYDLAENEFLVDAECIRCGHQCQVALQDTPESEVSMPDPTQPAPMSEERIKEIEQNLTHIRYTSIVLPAHHNVLLESADALLAEVRRLQAELNDGPTLEQLEKDCSEYATHLRNELTAVRAERDRLQAECDDYGFECARLDKRADRAEAAAGQLRCFIRTSGIAGDELAQELVASTAWLTGGNDERKSL